MKKILMSLFTIAVVGALITGGVMAYFSDTETSTGNTFTAGTLDLKLTGGQGSSDSVTGTWSSPAGWAPGDMVNATLEFTNTGTVDALEIHFKFYNLQNDGKSDGSNLMDAIIVTSFTERWNNYTSPNQAATIDSAYCNGDGKLTLAELAGKWAGTYFFRTYDNQGSMGSGDGVILEAGDQWDYDLILEFTFDPDAGNEYQGDTCSFDLEVTANQERFPTQGRP